MERVPFYGVVVACNDDLALRRLLPRVHRRVTTYGTSRGSNFLIRMGSSLGGSSQGGSSQAGSSQVGSSSNGSAVAAGEHSPVVHFKVTYKEKDLGEFTLHVPGAHNVLNATAAIAVGTALDIPAEQIRSALDDFRGVDRRFQFKGKSAGVSVIDDYGHHPTEIRATLAAARQCGFRRVHVIFQPHRFTRTRDLMDEFATAFADADTLCLLDIYPASERPIEGITAEALARRIAEAGNGTVKYAASFSDAVAAVAALARTGDMVLTLGAGSVSQLGAMMLETLEGAKQQSPG
jgi:UDP-N-acetylmuramate--alanine ligase